MIISQLKIEQTLESPQNPIVMDFVRDSYTRFRTITTSDALIHDIHSGMTVLCSEQIVYIINPLSRGSGCSSAFPSSMIWLSQKYAS